jgi:putative transposase
MKSFRVLNKEIQNVAWDKFVFMLLYKAESADKEVIQADPKNTSSMCSGCGDIIKKDLSIRIHKCIKCELVIDRDINAAINIFNRGKSLLKDNDLVWESRDILSELPKALELI